MQGRSYPIDVHGDDQDLAAAVARAPGALVRLHPVEDSDIGRAIGVYPGFEASGAAEIPMDALRLADGSLACNMVVIGSGLTRAMKLPLPWRSLVDRVLNYPFMRSHAKVRVDDREIYAGTAKTIVVAVGQFLGDLDVVPRGHPGDGRAEVQVYDVPRAERAEMRNRLHTGTHVPHPRIIEATGTRIDVSVWPGEWWLLDGHPRNRRKEWSFEVVPEAYRVLI